MMRDLKIFLLYSQHAFQYRARSFIWFLLAFLNPFVLLLFWQGILSQNTTLAGWSIDSIRTYYLLLMAGQAILINHVELTIGIVDIMQGELVRDLMKPYSYFKIKLLSESPWRFFQGFYAVVTITALSYVFGITLTFANSITMMLLAILIVINAFLLSFLFKAVIGFAAFWMTNIDSLLDTNEVLLFALSGMVLPLNLFPSWMQTFANFTPYPYILYYPITAIIGMHNIQDLIYIILAQFGVISVFTVLYKVMWDKGKKKFSGLGQ